MGVFYLFHCSPPRTSFIRKGQSASRTILVSFNFLRTYGGPVGSGARYTACLSQS